MADIHIQRDHTLGLRAARMIAFAWAEQVEAGIVSGFDDRREIHVNGNVLQARKNEWVVVGVMTVVAHQRAVIPLRMIELVARKSVVDKHQRAVCDDAGPGRGPVPGGQSDFTDMTDG